MIILRHIYDVFNYTQTMVWGTTLIRQPRLENVTKNSSGVVFIPMRRIFINVFIAAIFILLRLSFSQITQSNVFSYTYYDEPACMPMFSFAHTNTLTVKRWIHLSGIVCVLVVVCTEWESYDFNTTNDRNFMKLFSVVHWTLTW